MALVAREDLLQQDGQRPPVDDDVVEGQYQSVPVRSNVDQCHPEDAPLGELAEEIIREASGSV